jgi:hypothetical protein
VAARERVGGDVGERRWSIDPQQGWNVLRYEERANDRLVRSVSSKLARYGECWFPREVEYRNADGPYLTIRMRDVKLNDPSLPKHLTPEFIEVVPGTNVYHMFPDAPSEMVGFDGARFVDFEELRRRVRAGEVQRGEAFLRALDRLTDVGARERTAEKYTPSAWEKYVAKFIAEHQLDPAQTSRAWSIYRDCRSAANRYLLKAAAEIDQLDKRQEALKFLPDVNEAKTLAIKKAEVYRPVQEIFDEQLAPRLDKLLTRAQRALGETTATRPTSRSATRY